MLTSIRFKCTMNQNLNLLINNLVPFHKMHFLLSSYAPIESAKYYNSWLSVAQLTNIWFNKESMMAKCYP